MAVKLAGSATVKPKLAFSSTVGTRRIPRVDDSKVCIAIGATGGIGRRTAKVFARVVPQGPAARGPAAGEAAGGAACEIRRDAQPVQARAQHIGWTRLLERVFDLDLRRCPSCGARELKLIAAILQRAAIGRILTQLGLDPRPPFRGRESEAG